MKLVTVLIEEIKKSNPSPEILGKVTTIEEELKTADVNKERECFHALAEISSSVKDTKGEDTLLVDSLTSLYNILSTVADEGKEEEGKSVKESTASLYNILSSLLYVASDLETAIKYIKEMVLLVEVEKDKGGKDEEASEEQAVIDDKVVATETPMKTEGGKKYPAEAYLYVPDSKKPSTWKLRIWETTDAKVTVRQLGRAVAAIGKGFRGQKVQLAPGELPKIKSKLLALYKKMKVEDKDIPEILKKGKAELENIAVINTEPTVVVPPVIPVSPVETPVSTVIVADTEIVTLKDQLAVATTKLVEVESKLVEASKVIEVYKSKDIAIVRMNTLKDKGLAQVFATEEDVKAEIEFLMGISDMDFENHVKLLEKAKKAFDKPVVTTQQISTPTVVETVVASLHPIENSKTFESVIDEVQAIWFKE